MPRFVHVILSKGVVTVELRVLTTAIEKLNTRPRKPLNYRTPYEALLKQTVSEPET
jgi:IS30 family transposase